MPLGASKHRSAQTVMIREWRVVIAVLEVAAAKWCSSKRCSISFSSCLLCAEHLEVDQVLQGCCKAGHRSSMAMQGNSRSREGMMSTCIASMRDLKRMACSSLPGSDSPMPLQLCDNSTCTTVYKCPATLHQEHTSYIDVSVTVPV